MIFKIPIYKSYILSPGSRPRKAFQCSFILSLFFACFFTFLIYMYSVSAQFLPRNIAIDNFNASETYNQTQFEFNISLTTFTRAYNDLIKFELPALPSNYGVVYSIELKPTRPTSNNKIQVTPIGLISIFEGFGYRLQFHVVSGVFSPDTVDLVLRLIITFIIAFGLIQFSFVQCIEQICKVDTSIRIGFEKKVE